jgi:hypothetical protein
MIRASFMGNAAVQPSSEAGNAAFTDEWQIGPIISS